MKTKTIFSRSFLPPFAFSPFSIIGSVIICLFLLALCYHVGFLPLIVICMTCFTIKKCSRFDIRWPQKKKLRSIFFIGDPEPEINVKKPRTENLGTGAEVHSAGTVYSGEFLNGKRNGNGVFRARMKSLYEGNWVDGFCDGYGFEKLVGIGEFRGEFMRGMKHGFGSYWYENGDRYEGAWRYGLKHGTGEMMLFDGSSYIGEFKQGVKHGLGIFRFRNGDIYMGEYFGDKFLGFGVYEFANGDLYQGSWHEGQMQGFGIYTKISGEIIAGIWDSGFLITEIPHQDPSIQKSLQATQKVIERCLDLQRVEGQVLMAVLVANESAEYARLASYTAIEKLNTKFLVTCVKEIIEIYNLIRSSASSFQSTYQFLRKRLYDSSAPSQIIFVMSVALINVRKRVGTTIRVKAKKIAKSPSVHKAFQVIRKTWRNVTIRLQVKAMVGQIKRTKSHKDDWSHIL